MPQRHGLRAPKTHLQRPPPTSGHVPTPSGKGVCREHVPHGLGGGGAGEGSGDTVLGGDWTEVLIRWHGDPTPGRRSASPSDYSVGEGQRTPSACSKSTPAVHPHRGAAGPKGEMKPPTSAARGTPGRPKTPCTTKNPPSRGQLRRKARADLVVERLFPGGALLRFAPVPGPLARATELLRGSALWGLSLGETSGAGASQPLSPKPTEE